MATSLPISQEPLDEALLNGAQLDEALLNGAQLDEALLDGALRLAAENAAATLKSTTPKKANLDWNVGSSDEKENEPTERKISFSGLLSVGRFAEDGTILAENKNAFPFPVGTNPDVQTVSYGMDIKDIEDRSALQNFDVAAVLKNDPTTIVAYFTGTRPTREIKTGFGIGFLVATTTLGRDAVCFVVWHAKNDQISVINLEGTETHRGNLPALPIGWTWSGARFQTSYILELQMYNTASKEYSTMECQVLTL
jgi:hypothetical protein